MGRTFLNFILDESGSMTTVREATISGFNEYLAEQKRLAADETLVTLTKFNTQCSTVHSAKPLQDVPELTKETYTPGGMTALYDAIAQSVKAVDRLVKEGDRVLCCILTDGLESSSRETNRKQVKEIIEARQNAGNWTFAYLGANQDAWAVGASIGVQASNTQTYSSDPAGTRLAFEATSRATVCYRESSARRTDSLFAPKKDTKQ